jgi:hypothetical protein
MTRNVTPATQPHILLRMRFHDLARRGQRLDFRGAESLVEVIAVQGRRPNSF